MRSERAPDSHDRRNTGRQSQHADWESREAYDRFRDERLFRAIKSVSGMDPTGGRQPTIAEFAVHDYVKP
jgi:hypothetical protein